MLTGRAEVADHSVRAIDRQDRRSAQQNTDAEPETRKRADQILSEKSRCSGQRDKGFVHGLTQRGRRLRWSTFAALYLLGSTAIMRRAAGS